MALRARLQGSSTRAAGCCCKCVLPSNRLSHGRTCNDDTFEKSVEKCSFKFFSFAPCACGTRPFLQHTHAPPLRGRSTSCAPTGSTLGGYRDMSWRTAYRRKRCTDFTEKNTPRFSCGRICRVLQAVIGFVAPAYATRRSASQECARRKLLLL